MRDSHYSRPLGVIFFLVGFKRILFRYLCFRGFLWLAEIFVSLIPRSDVPDADEGSNGTETKTLNLPRLPRTTLNPKGLRALGFGFRALWGEGGRYEASDEPMTTS